MSVQLQVQSFKFHLLIEPNLHLHGVPVLLSLSVVQPCPQGHLGGNRRSTDCIYIMLFWAYLPDKRAAWHKPAMTFFLSHSFSGGQGYHTRCHLFIKSAAIYAKSNNILILNISLARLLCLSLVQLKHFLISVCCTLQF